MALRSARRRWCFTYFFPNTVLFNAGPDRLSWDEIRVHESFPKVMRGEESPSWLRYLVCQAEVAPDTGRLHLQGYCEATRPVRYTQLQRELCVPNAHCEGARGSSEDSTAYCTKVTGPDFADRSELTFLSSTRGWRVRLLSSSVPLAKARGRVPMLIV